jgi:hypothetical protein
MNAGRDYGKAVEQAKANAKFRNEPRFVISYGGCYWVDGTRPRGGFGSMPYTEVLPDGTTEEKQTEV